MHNRALVVLGSLAFGLFAVPHAGGQVLRTLSSNSTPAAVNSICGQPLPPSSSLPPARSGPVVYLISPCFQRQGGQPRSSPETYLKDIWLKPSRPSLGEWTPYDAAAEQTILQDFQRLSTNHALKDLTIEIRDFTFPNGVVGKLVIYDMIDRN